MQMHIYGCCCGINTVFSLVYNAGARELAKFSLSLLANLLIRADTARHVARGIAERKIVCAVDADSGLRSPAM